MAYEYTNKRGNKYYLHGRTTTLRNGRQQKIYYFAREQKDGAIDRIPEGYMVSETANGLPVLKRTNN